MKLFKRTTVSYLLVRQPKISAVRIWIPLPGDGVYEGVTAPGQELVKLLLAVEGGGLGSVVPPALVHALLPVGGVGVELYSGYLSSEDGGLEI